MAKELNLPDWGRPESYAPHLRFPNASEMAQNHADFYRYLHDSTLPDKDERMNLVAEDLEYTPDDIQQILQTNAFEPEQTIATELPVNTETKVIKNGPGLWSPEVVNKDLAPNEKAFFTGLAQGKFSSSKALHGGNEFVWVSTTSSGRKREIYKQTFGNWGDSFTGKGYLKIYLSSPNFDFLLDREITEDMIGEKRKFAPLLYGLIHSNLSEVERSIALSNGPLLKEVMNKFGEFFGFELGTFRDHLARKPKPGEEAGNAFQTQTIKIKNLNKVIAALEDHYSVGCLPFIDKLPKLVPSNTTE